MRARLVPVLLTACGSSSVVATVELEPIDGGDTVEIRAEDDTFHLNGFVSVLDDGGPKIEGQLLQLQPGQYLTTFDFSDGANTWGSNVVVDVDVHWNASGRFPFTHEVSFVEGQVSSGMGVYDVVGGGFSIDNQGCRSANGLGSALECGGSFSEDWSGGVDFDLGGPFEDALFTAPTCADALTDRIRGTVAHMTESKLDLGGGSLSCKTTQDQALTCGDDVRNVSADGCDDWRVTWFAMPNATQQNAALTIVVAGGADCGGTPKTCRSLYYGTPGS